MASQGVFGRYERERKPAKRRRLTAKFKAHLTIGGHLSGSTGRGRRGMQCRWDLSV